MVETMNGKAWFQDCFGGYAHRCRMLTTEALVTLCGRSIQCGIGASFHPGHTRCPYCEAISELEGST